MGKIICLVIIIYTCVKGNITRSTNLFLKLCYRISPIMTTRCYTNISTFLPKVLIADMLRKLSIKKGWSLYSNLHFTISSKGESFK